MVGLKKRSDWVWYWVTFDLYLRGELGNFSVFADIRVSISIL